MSRKADFSSGKQLFKFVKLLYLYMKDVPYHTRMQFVTLRKVNLFPFKDVRAHCYCASLVRTQFIRHVRATSSISSARIESKLNKNIELMTFALTWCANIFVGSSVTPTFFSADRFLF